MSCLSWDLELPLSKILHDISKLFQCHSISRVLYLWELSINNHSNNFTICCVLPLVILYNQSSVEAILYKSLYSGCRPISSFIRSQLKNVLYKLVYVSIISYMHNTKLDTQCKMLQNNFPRNATICQTYYIQNIFYIERK